MKSSFFLLLCTFGLFYSESLYCYSQKGKFANFVKIKGGKMIKRIANNRDKTRVVFVEPFIVSSFKVTNKEYIDVCLYARDNCPDSYKILSDLYVNVDPEYEERYGINSGTLMNYLSELHNYPVIGLSYRQIIEFINVKSKMDGVTYRLLTPDEYDFIAYEVVNVIDDKGELKLIQSKNFDDMKKRKINLLNENYNSQNEEKNKKKKSCVKKCNKRKKRRRNDINKGKKEIKYNFLNYYNLRDNKVKGENRKVFFTEVDKYEPNILGVYDIVGNTLEITSENKDVCLSLGDAKKNIFTLCGGSCFDFYNLVKIENKQKDYYDNMRYDRGFRLVVEIH